MAETAWRIEPLWDEPADGIGLSYLGRSEAQFAAADCTKWGMEPLPSDHHPVQMILYAGTWLDRHLVKGVMQNHTLVSAELRALLLECDPEGVHFDPAEVSLRQGEILRDRYWMLKVPRLLDALIPEKSNVRAFKSRRTGKFLGWNYVGNEPPTLKKSVIDGNHVWRLPSLMPTDLYISDLLKTEMDRRALGPFKVEPVPLA